MTSILLSYVRTQLNVMYSKAVVDTYYSTAESGFRADEVGAHDAIFLPDYLMGEGGRRIGGVIESLIQLFSVPIL